MIQSTTIKHVEPIRVASMPHHGAYNQIGCVFGKLMDWARPRGLLSPKMIVLGIYHHDPRTTPEQDLRSEACIGVGPEVGADPSAGVTIQTIPAGRFAVAIFKGPYEGLAGAWGEIIHTWLPKNGEAMSEGLCYEVYLNSIMDTKPEDLLTAIHVPLE